LSPTFFTEIQGSPHSVDISPIRVVAHVYKKQTDKAKAEGVSNCSYCAIGHDAKKAKIWPLSAMDADHVTAWSKGGATDESNCELLCKSHNRAKGNA